MTISTGPGRTLFQFVRFWSRRWTGGPDAARGRDVMVTEAVASKGTHGASINEIAGELGLDQSGASRMVADATRRGYLAKSHGGDARRRVVVVTPQGHRLIAQAHRWQEDVFAELADGWSAREIETITLLMQRLYHAGQKMQAAGDAD